MNWRLVSAAVGVFLIVYVVLYYCAYVGQRRTCEKNGGQWVVARTGQLYVSVGKAIVPFRYSIYSCVGGNER